MKDIKLPLKKEDEIEQYEAAPHVEENSNENNVGQVDQGVILQGKKNKYRRIRKIVASFMGLAVLFFATTLYSQYQVYILKKKANESTLAQLESSSLKDPRKVIETVSRHMILPTTTPQVALVEDASKLQSSQQSFFESAINGDVVLMYTDMIVLYRPSKDIIVSVGDISKGDR